MLQFGVNQLTWLEAAKIKIEIPQTLPAPTHPNRHFSLSKLRLLFVFISVSGKKPKSPLCLTVLHQIYDKNLLNLPPKSFLKLSPQHFSLVFILICNYVYL